MYLLNCVYLGKSGYGQEYTHKTEGFTTQNERFLIFQNFPCYTFPDNVFLIDEREEC